MHPIVSLLSVEVKDALVSKQLGGLLEALTLLTDVKQICQPESYLQDLIKAVKELQLERDGLEETTVEMEKAADAKNIEHVAKIASRDQLLDDLQKETVKAKEAREKEHMAEIAELNAKSHQGILEWKVKLEQAAQKVNEHAADITAKDQLIDDLQKATTDMEKTVEEKETTHLAEINQLKSTLSDLEASKANLEKTTAEEETAHLSEITQLQSNMQEMEETITQLRRAAETSELDHNVEITCRDQLIDDLRKFRVAYAKRVTSAVESALHCAQGGMQGIEAEDVD